MQAEAQLLLSSAIIDAFGSARTGRNDNSSRFGRLFKVRSQSPLVLASCVLWLCYQYFDCMYFAGIVFVWRHALDKMGVQIELCYLNVPHLFGSDLHVR